MRVDDFNGERVEIEDASNSQLAEMDADYTKYLSEGPSGFYGGKFEFNMYEDFHKEIKHEIEWRKKEGTWDR